jgi:hypothetical protein
MKNKYLLRLESRQELHSLQRRLCIILYFVLHDLVLPESDV